MSKHAHPYDRSRDGARISRAKCQGFTQESATFIASAYCASAYCPRHEPRSYADFMARHATDSSQGKGAVR